MKNFIKNNLRLIIVFIIGIIVSTTVVSAATILFASSDVNFSSNVIASKNVQDAIDEVYNSFTNGCYPGYDKGTVSGGTYTCTKKSSIPDQTIVFTADDVVYDNSNGNLTSTNVADALDEIAAKVPYCKEGYTKTNEQSNSYNCKKTITITANNQTITYGDSVSQNTNQVTVEGLETGHSLNSITLTGSTSNVPGGTITPSNAVIYDSGSNNITSTYTINYETGTLTINRKATTMSISPTSGTVAPGASTTTTITTDGDGTKSCETSSSSIATCSVSGNTVTINGVAQGTAVITVSQASGTTHLAATDVTYTATIESAQPTCPGESCVYTKSSNTIGQAINGTLGTDYKTSYDDYGNYFLAHILNNGIIEESYACGINANNNNAVFCLRGGVDEASLTDKPIFTDNVGRLNTAFPSCNATTSGSSASCTGAVTGEAKSGGYVRVYKGYSSCSVYGSGSSYC